MEALLRLVEGAFRSLLHARGGNAPALVDFRHDFEAQEWRNPPHFVHLFTARFSDDSRERFCVPAESHHERYSIDVTRLRQEVRRLYSRLYEECMRERLRERFGPAGGGMVTSNIAPPEPEATLMQQMQELQRLYIQRRVEQDRLQREAMFWQQQAVAAQQAAMMQAQCGCPACQPAAKSKSLALLKQWLSPEQLAQYEKGRFIEVTGSASGRRYRIKEAPAQNVYEIDRDGREIMGYCFGPEGTLAVGDIMLAQKIALETDEPAAIRVANNFGGAGISAMMWQEVRDLAAFSFRSRRDA